MLVILGILQLLLCIIILIYEYNNKSISVFFWAVLLLLFNIPHLLEIVVGITKYSESVFLKASIFVIGFEIIYILSRMVINSKKYSSIVSENEIRNMDLDTKKNRQTFNKILKLNYLVFFIFTLYFLLRFDSIKNLSWGEIYQASLNANSLFDKILEFLKSLNHLLFFAVTGLLITTIYKKKKFSSCFIIFLILYYSFITRNRIALLPLLVSFILIIIIKNKKIKLKQMIYFSFLGMLCIYIVYAIWIFRHAGTLENFKSTYTMSSFNKEVFNAILNNDGELSLRKIFYYFIYIDNNFPGLQSGATYIRLLLMFIPSSLCFGIKPPDFAITMSSAYTGNLYNTLYSVHPTFYGDLFANFNFLGILFGLFWALFFKSLDKFLCKRNIITRCSLLVTWGSCFVIMARGSVYNSIFIGVVSTIILYIVEKVKIITNKNL